MGFWRTFLGVAVRPRFTLANIEKDDRAVLYGILALLLVIAVYTVILVIFVQCGYPAAAPSVLPIAIRDQYKVQVWYQGPLFLVATCMAAGFLALISRMMGGASKFGVAFARISLATTLPFAFTTMLVELGIALLLLAGVLGPQTTLRWLSGEGSWFANGYQLVAWVWMFGLLTVTIRLTTRRQWWVSCVLSLALMIVYGLPVGLFIR